jgi:class 3 adenylate cyclase
MPAAAILAADVAGYSRLMGTDEVGTLSALKARRREIVDPAIAAHKGRLSRLPATACWSSSQAPSMP